MRNGLGAGFCVKLLQHGSHLLELMVIMRQQLRSWLKPQTYSCLLSFILFCSVRCKGVVGWCNHKIPVHALSGQAVVEAVHAC